MFQLVKYGKNLINSQHANLSYLLNLFIKLIFLLGFVLWAWMFSLNSSHTQTRFSIEGVTQHSNGEKVFDSFTIKQLEFFDEKRLIVLNQEFEIINYLSSNQLAIAHLLEQIGLLFCAVIVVISLVLWQQKEQQRLSLFAFCFVACALFSGCFTLFNLDVNNGLSLYTSIGILSVCFVFYASCYSLLNARSQTASTLLAFASQSGTAMSIAERFHKQLPNTFDLRCLSSLTPDCLSQYRQVLLIASTYGEGAPPETAVTFLNKMKQTQMLTSKVNFSILALGDRTYQHFCAFGHQLAHLLSSKGAKQITDVIEVDRGDKDAISNWWQQISHFIGKEQSTVSLTDNYHRLNTHSNTLVNPQKPKRAAHRIIFKNEGLTYQAGDLLEVIPKYDAIKCQQMLREKGFDCQQPVIFQNTEMPLFEAVRQSNWLGESATSAQQLVDVLTPLPPRVYSIASAPHESKLEIFVRRHFDDLGKPGLASNYLCDLNENELISARIRHHANFHLPKHLCPTILIGAGTGIAPLISLLKGMSVNEQRVPAWLFFGEQSKSTDFYFKDEINTMLSDKSLTQFTPTWSRDGGGYITEQLEQHASSIKKWMLDDNAVIYLCGKQKGFGESVLSCLKSILEEHVYPSLIEDKRIRVDLY